VVGQQREILPGQDTKVSMVFASTWPLAWMTTSLTGSLEPVGNDIGVGLEPLEATSAGALAIPWPQLVVLAILALLVFALLKLRSRQKARHEEALARARAEGARAAARGDGATPVTSG
jgi:hypothetical protein